jgi:hypothetical protein
MDETVCISVIDNVILGEVDGVLVNDDAVVGDGLGVV